MAIDFSDLHRARIPHIVYRYDVAGSTLQELAGHAYEHARELFGEHPFAIDGLDITEVRTDGGQVVAYQATATARAN